MTKACFPMAILWTSLDNSFMYPNSKGLLCPSYHFAWAVPCQSWHNRAESDNKKIIYWIFIFVWFSFWFCGDREFIFLIKNSTYIFFARKTKANKYIITYFTSFVSFCSFVSFFFLFILFFIFWFLIIKYIYFFPQCNFGLFSSWLLLSSWIEFALSFIVLKFIFAVLSFYLFYRSLFLCLEPKGFISSKNFLRFPN